MVLFRSAYAPVERIFYLGIVLSVLLMHTALEMENMQSAHPVLLDSTSQRRAQHHQISSVLHALPIPTLWETLPPVPLVRPTLGPSLLAQASAVQPTTTSLPAAPCAHRVQRIRGVLLGQGSVRRMWGIMIWGAV